MVMTRDAREKTGFLRPASNGGAEVASADARIGSAMVAALANAKRTVDFEVHDFGDDPRAAGA